MLVQLRQLKTWNLQDGRDEGYLLFKDAFEKCFEIPLHAYSYG